MKSRYFLTLMLFAVYVIVIIGPCYCSSRPTQLVQDVSHGCCSEVTVSDSSLRASCCCDDNNQDNLQPVLKTSSPVLEDAITALVADAFAPQVFIGVAYTLGMALASHIPLLFPSSPPSLRAPPFVLS